MPFYLVSVTAENERATESEEGLRSSLDAEMNRAEGVETSLRGDIEDNEDGKANCVERWLIKPGLFFFAK